MKKRREYLQKKATANVQTTIFAIAVLCWAAIWLMGLGTLFMIRDKFLMLTWSAETASNLAFALFILLILGIASCMSLMAWRLSAKSAKSIPYVPPVREQIAALPAEAILVRGSDRPSATSEELLRAATSREANPAEELLRAETRNLH